MSLERKLRQHLQQMVEETLTLGSVAHAISLAWGSVSVTMAGMVKVNFTLIVLVIIITCLCRMNPGRVRQHHHH